MRLLIRPKPPTPTNSIVVRPPRLRFKMRPLRVLDFDIENRPLSYLGSDFTTSEITAVAWAWTHEPQYVSVRLLGEEDLPTILTEFVKVYEQADLVTGHYIRGHDLPMLNGALVEFGMSVLPDRMTQDTKVDFIRTKGISLSQESLGAMRRLEHEKVQMNQAKWRAANRLTSEGLAEARKRVTGDVRQHMQLREELLKRGWLSAPKMWRSGSAQAVEYQP